MPIPPELAPLVNDVAEIAALSLFAVSTASLLGYFLDEGFGAGYLAFWTSIAAAICLSGYLVFALVSLTLFDPADPLIWSRRWAIGGLLVAIMIVTELSVRTGRNRGNSGPGKRRGSRFLQWLWLGFCFAGWIGHLAGKWVGLLTITLPAVVIFWGALYYFAHFILPLDKDQQVSTAFRCLLTFSAGTNYPYYAMEGRRKVERVPGNQFSDLFAGPGIFLTGPDYAVAVSNGLKFVGVRGPGVVFTKKFETIQKPMELRPQQRPYTVEATTKDGIQVEFTTFGPFQLDAGKQRPELGKPFPLRSKSIFKAFYARPVDVKRSEANGEVVEEREQRRWDELYEIIGTHVMQDIIAKYKFDELCEPFDPEKDPRTEIAAEYRSRMREELSKHGIKIPGGGISNLLPADTDAIFERRVANWQAEWQRKLLEQIGAAEAEAERLIGQTRAQVQAEMIQNISEAIEEVTTDDREVIINTVALRFIESLNQMVEKSEVEERLSPEVARTMGDLPRVIGKG